MTLRFRPLSPPPHISPADGVAAHKNLASRNSIWCQDVIKRINTLFEQLLSRAPGSETPQPKPLEERSIADWRELALFLAIKHKEPGFVIAKHELKVKRRLGDEQDYRDSLMDNLLYRKTVTESCEGAAVIRYVTETKENQMTGVEASLIVCKALHKSNHRAVIIPTAETIEKQYSTRRNQALRDGRDPEDRGLPIYARYYLDWDRTFSRIKDLAAGKPFAYSFGAMSNVRRIRRRRQRPKRRETDKV